MGRRIPSRETLINSTSTSVHTGVRVSDYRTCILSIKGSPSANLKVFIKGSIGDTRPDFTVASAVRSTNNQTWDFLEVIDMQNGAAIDGDTGVALSGNVIRLVEVNVNALDWLSVHSTAVVAGTVTVAAALMTNE